MVLNEGTIFNNDPPRRVLRPWDQKMGQEQKSSFRIVLCNIKKPISMHA